MSQNAIAMLVDIFHTYKDKLPSDPTFKRGGGIIDKNVMPIEYTSSNIPVSTDPVGSDDGILLPTYANKVKGIEVKPAVPTLTNLLSKKSKKNNIKAKKGVRGVQVSSSGVLAAQVTTQTDVNKPIHKDVVTVTPPTTTMVPTDLAHDKETVPILPNSTVNVSVPQISTHSKDTTTAFTINKIDVKFTNDKDISAIDDIFTTVKNEIDAPNDRDINAMENIFTTVKNDVEAHKDGDIISAEVLICNDVNTIIQGAENTLAISDVSKDVKIDEYAPMAKTTDISESDHIESSEDSGDEPSIGRHPIITMALDMHTSLIDTPIPKAENVHPLYTVFEQNFIIGESTLDGHCFYDSVYQGLQHLFNDCPFALNDLIDISYASYKMFGFHSFFAANACRFKRVSYDHFSEPDTFNQLSGDFGFEGLILSVLLHFNTYLAQFEPSTGFYTYYVTHGFNGTTIQITQDEFTKQTQGVFLHIANHHFIPLFPKKCNKISFDMGKFIYFSTLSDSAIRLHKNDVHNNQSVTGLLDDRGQLLFTFKQRFAVRRNCLNLINSLQPSLHQCVMDDPEYITRHNIKNITHLIRHEFKRWESIMTNPGVLLSAARFTAGTSHIHALSIKAKTSSVALLLSALEDTQTHIMPSSPGYQQFQERILYPQHMYGDYFPTEKVPIGPFQARTSHINTVSLMMTILPCIRDVKRTPIEQYTPLSLPFFGDRYSLNFDVCPANTKSHYSYTHHSFMDDLFRTLSFSDTREITPELLALIVDNAQTHAHLSTPYYGITKAISDYCQLDVIVYYQNVNAYYHILANTSAHIRFFWMNFETGLFYECYVKSTGHAMMKKAYNYVDEHTSCSSSEIPMYYRYDSYYDPSGQLLLRTTYLEGKNLIQFQSDINPELTRVPIITGMPSYPRATIQHTTKVQKEKQVGCYLSGAGLTVSNARALRKMNIKLLDTDKLFTEVGANYVTSAKAVIDIHGKQTIVIFKHIKSNSHGHTTNMKFTIVYCDTVTEGKVFQPLMPRMVMNYENSLFSVETVNWGASFLLNYSADFEYVISQAIGIGGKPKLNSLGLYVDNTRIAEPIKKSISSYVLLAMTPRYDIETKKYISGTMQCLAMSYLGVEKERITLGCGQVVTDTMVDVHKHACVSIHYRARVKDESFVGPKCSVCRETYPMPEIALRCEMLCKDKKYRIENE